MASWLVRSTPEGAVRVEDIWCVLGQDTLLSVPLSTQVYKWVPANLMLGVTLRCSSIPSRGEEKYSMSLHATATGISAGLVGKWLVRRLFLKTTQGTSSYGISLVVKSRLTGNSPV